MGRAGRPSSGLQVLAALGMVVAVVLAIGGVLGVLGAVVTFGSNGAPPTCDGQVMSRGDSCQEYSGGAYQGSESYDDMLRNQRSSKREAPVWLGLGAVALVVGGTGILLLVRVVNRWKAYGGARS